MRLLARLSLRRSGVSESVLLQWRWTRSCSYSAISASVTPLPFFFIALRSLRESGSISLLPVSSTLRMFDALWSLCLSFDAIKQELSCDPIVTAPYLLGKLGRGLVVVH